MKGNINMSKNENLKNEIKAAKAHLAELEAKLAEGNESHGFNFRDLAEIFSGQKVTDDKTTEADLSEFLGIDKDKEAHHDTFCSTNEALGHEIAHKDLEARVKEINKTLGKVFGFELEVEDEFEAEDKPESVDLGKVFNDTVASVKTKGNELLTKVKGHEAVAKVRENELFNKAQTTATDLFTKAKTKASDAFEAGKDKFYEIKEDYSYFKDLKAKYPDAEFVKLGEDTFSVRLPQFGNDFVFTFVDEHSLVAVGYIAEEEQEPTPVHEDGFITSVVSGHAHVHHTIEFVNAVEVEGLDDVDTITAVLNDYFTL